VKSIGVILEHENTHRHSLSLLIGGHVNPSRWTGMETNRANVQTLPFVTITGSPHGAVVIDCHLVIVSLPASPLNPLSLRSPNDIPVQILNP
jgi:hypothetical protein